MEIKQGEIVEEDCPRCSRTLCFARSSFESGEDMILRRTDEGALKCALRALRREEETSVNDDDKYFIVSPSKQSSDPSELYPCHPAYRPTKNDNFVQKYGYSMDWKRTDRGCTSS